MYRNKKTLKRTFFDSRPIVAGAAFIAMLAVPAVADAELRRTGRGVSITINRPASGTMFYRLQTNFSILAGSDFGGGVSYGDMSQQFLVPDLTPGGGIGFGIGRRIGIFCPEIRMFADRFGGSWGDSLVTDVGAWRFAFDAVFKFDMTRSDVRPYVLGIMGYEALIVSGGHVENSGEVSSYLFSGVGFSAGLGLEYHATRRVAVFVEASYRASMFFKINQYETDDWSIGHGFVLTVGTVFSP